MNKICSKCGGIKELEDFVKNKKCKNGREGSCKKCRNAYNRKTGVNKRWPKNNPIRVKELAKKWRRNNPDKAQEATKRWIRNNPKKYKLLVKKFNQKRMETLHDDYVKSAIQSVLKIPCSEITAEMIQVKREQLKFHRALRQLKRAVNESNR